MKRWTIMTLLIPLLLLGSGCMMMMHKGMHGEENHGSHSSEKTSTEDKAEKTGEAPQNESHKEHSKSKKSSKTLVILGGVGMDLMMLLMFIYGNTYRDYIARVPAWIPRFGIGGVGSVLYNILTRTRLMPVPEAERRILLHRRHL